jgi:hypothetical protein
MLYLQNLIFLFNAFKFRLRSIALQFPRVRLELHSEVHEDAN